jgi:hypothetical protein
MEQKAMRKAKGIRNWENICPKGVVTVLVMALWPAAGSLRSYAWIQDTASTARQGVVESELGTLNDSIPSGLTKTGNPQTIDSPYGKAVQFDGVGDGLFVETNPLQDLPRFTLEVVFRPDPKGLPEQRFLHMGELRGDRVMLETRLTDEDQWYLDAHLRSGDSAKTLIDKEKTHRVGAWYHVALVVDNGKMDTFVDGKHELGAIIRFIPFKGGKTSIGVRMNRVYWFKGAICRIRITPKCLSPHEFRK